MKEYYEMLRLTRDGWEITQFKTKKEVMDKLGSIIPTKDIKVRKVVVEEIDILNYSEPTNWEG